MWFLCCRFQCKLFINAKALVTFVPAIQISQHTQWYHEYQKSCVKIVWNVSEKLRGTFFWCSLLHSLSLSVSHSDFMWMLNEYMSHEKGKKCLWGFVCWFFILVPDAFSFSALSTVVQYLRFSKCRQTFFFSAQLCSPFFLFFSSPTSQCMNNKNKFPVDLVYSLTSLYVVIVIVVVSFFCWRIWNKEFIYIQVVMLFCRSKKTKTSTWKLWGV